MLTSVNKILVLRALGGLLLAGVLVFLYVNSQDYGARREGDVLAQLVSAKSIETRWDIAVAEARADLPARSAPVQPDDVVQIVGALDAAAREIPTRVMQATIADLKKTYAEKAELVGQYVAATADARQALAAAMRADSLIGQQVRAAWREFPQRERLVAVENIVARSLAQAQAYNRTPTPEHRSSLQGYAADIARLHDLPRPIEATLARLGADLHQLLLLKPLVQTIDGRFAAFATGGYIEEVTALVQRKHREGAARRATFRTYFLAYLALLLAGAGYTIVRVRSRIRGLDAHRIDAEAALADAQRNAPPRAKAHDVVDIVVEPYRTRQSQLRATRNSE